MRLADARPAPRLVLAALSLLPAACAGPGKEPGKGAGEVWRLTVDNDSYNFDDGNYTNGVELLWVSAADPPGARELRWLPGLGGERERRLAISAHHAVFTPENLALEDPGPDERPYAGALWFDASVLARDERSLTAWVLRLGVVGEASFAEELQKEIHPWFGAADPEGWDTQLEDEPVLNLGFEHRHRLDLDSDPVFDLTPSFAAHAGTWYTGLAAALRLRLGPDLPRGMAPLPPRTGYEIHPLTGETPGGAGDGAPWYAFLDLEGHGTLHYLPLDGNVFRDSRDAERRPLVGKTSLGVSVAHGPWVLVLAYSLLTDAYEAQGNPGQFGSISLAWHG